MKITWKFLVGLLLTAFMVVSCEDDTMDDLEGVYTPPESYNLSSLSSQIREKSSSLFIFSISLTDSESNTLEMQLTAADWTLPAGTYTASDTTENETYLASATTFNGTTVESGSIIIELEDSTNYSMSDVILYLTDGTVLKLSGEFTIAYEEPEVVETYTYTVSVTVPATYTSSTDYSTVEITGSQLNTIKVINESNDTIAVLEIISAEGATDLTGDYRVLDGSSVEMAIGNANNGYYLDYAWYGYAGVYTGGSYYIASGDTNYMRTGTTINVVDEDGVLTLSSEDVAILDLETLRSSSGGTWQTLSETGSFGYSEATKVETYSYVNVITTPATYTSSTDYSTVEISGSQLNTIMIINSSNDTVAVFEIITDEGATDLSGDYSVLDGSSVEMAIGNANNGYYLDYAWYGYSGVYTGGCYYIESSDTNFIRSGSTISVTDAGGVLSISGSDLNILDLETLISSSGATWQNLSTLGSCSYANLEAKE